jgi:hypothetical protein
MQNSLAADGLVRRAANRHLGKSDREATGVLSSAQRHTHFLDSARINRGMTHSDFRFGGLKSEISTVFLVLPPERLETHARWLRLLVVQALQDIARTPENGGPPVLFLLDEVAALGRLEPIERAFGYMAGYGVQLWPILQDMHQLWSTYGERAGTFLSNAGGASLQRRRHRNGRLGVALDRRHDGRLRDLRHEHFASADPALQHAQHVDHHAPGAPRPHHAGRGHAPGSVRGDSSATWLAADVGA